WELLLYLLQRPDHAQEARAQQRRYLAALADQYRQCRPSTGGRGACQTLAQLVASQGDGLALHGGFLEPANTRRHIRAQALRAVLALLKEDALPTGTTPGPGNGTQRGTVRRQRSVGRVNPPGLGSA